MAKRIREKTIVTSSSIVLSILLLKFVPRSKVREAHVSFLFQQVITWFFGLLVVEKGYLRYPYRILFKKASRSSFAFEYFIFPAITVLFNLSYPKSKGILSKVFHIFSYSGVITGLEIIAVKYTKLITYVKWKWYWSFLSLSFSFILSRLYFRWFFKD
ncbi:hypothetical protein DS745_23440 [Anaerobacillus alkaliphilus]|uniref:Uncharacterized protein n=1 Tax=Anaerobacillus alkaliphilus TaxID=1548597 RepID=A0A4Q0VQL2_9BACI|nr:CBO0543 family protein [Anaerobacillus alkaliphilus]RXI96655.1 hypothetical protein DS745_23440 [Anaerobacillus alkaliphilus]